MKRYIDPEVVFKDEIDCITSNWHKECFRQAINKAPDHFWVIASSTTGKYHPEADLGIGGNVRHTKAVFWVAEELLRNTLLYPFDEETKNDIRVACLLHDSVKLGIEEPIQYTVHNHPMLIRELLCPLGEWIDTEEDLDKWNRICDLIESHMGMWNTKNKKPGIAYTPADDVVLPLPVSEPQKLVHLADYIASRKIISVSLVGTPPSTSHSNTSEPPSQAQLNYLSNLVKQCTQKGVLKGDSLKIPDTLTKSEASVLIQKLLDLLN